MAIIGKNNKAASPMNMQYINMGDNTPADIAPISPLTGTQQGGQ
jgi:hypothetical protein